MHMHVSDKRSVLIVTADTNGTNTGTDAGHRLPQNLTYAEVIFKMIWPILFMAARLAEAETQCSAVQSVDPNSYGDLVWELGIRTNISSGCQLQEASRKSAG